MSVVGTQGPTALWYLTRATGAVALLLLTLSMVLGVLNWRRWSIPRWPRFVLDALHRDVSLLILVFIVLHVVTSLLDGFAPLHLLDSFVPLRSAYRPLWVGFGAASFDLLLAVAITSVLRQRIGYRIWRVTHVLAYAAWPVALLHTVGTGSDIKQGWLLVLCALCLAAILIVVALRAANGAPGQAGRRAAVLGGAALGSLALIAWLPSGPLAAGWARRAGTPASLLLAVNRAQAGSAATSPSSKATSSAAPSAGPRGAFAAPFRAQLQGVLSESGSASVTIDMALRLSGAGSRRLNIRLQGQPLAGGGVSMSASQVSLGAGGQPSLYSGHITALQGANLDALVARRTGASLRLSVALAVDARSRAVSGTVVATAVRAGG